MGIRTDLAAEALRHFSKELPQGVAHWEKPLTKGTLTVTEITTPQAAETIGKPMGVYVAMESGPLWQDQGDRPEDMEAVAAGLRMLLPEEGLILVVGLGNREITPDALGPATAEQILATRHLHDPIAEETGLSHLRKVAALTPNVLGKTGIEAAETVSAVVREIQPTAVIVVDALAAGEVSRLGTVVQMADSGISPGSGVMNRRLALNRETLGVPVIAAGIPTVVDLSNLMDGADSHIITTPREVDLLIQRGARFLSLCINRALQPQLSLEEIALLLS